MAASPLLDENGNSLLTEIGDILGTELDDTIDLGGPPIPGFELADENGLSLLTEIGAVLQTEDVPAAPDPSTPPPGPPVPGGPGSPIPFPQDPPPVPVIKPTGTVSDMVWRLGKVLPSRWFPDPENAPVLQSVLNGLGAGLSALYGQISYAADQARIKTATDSFLDLASFDFLGGSLPRRLGEPDATYSARIRAEIVRPRATRASVVRVLTDLTGRAPAVFEPALTTDTGGYYGGGAGTGFAYANSDGTGGAGAWGSLDLASQAFVQARRAIFGGIPNVGGYYSGSGWAGGGYGEGAIEYVSEEMNPGQITDAEIYAAIASVMPAGGVAWAQIST